MIVTNAFANDEFYGKSTHGQFPKGLIFSLIVPSSLSMFNYLCILARHRKLKLPNQIYIYKFDFCSKAISLRYNEITRTKFNAMRLSDHGIGE